MTIPTHEVIYEPGYIKGRERGNMHIRFRLNGPNGSIELLLLTGWYPDRRVSASGPTGTVYMHWKTPMRGYGADDAAEPCTIFDECWGDAAYADGDRIAAIFVREGEDALWDELDNWYRTIDSESEGAI